MRRSAVLRLALFATIGGVLTLSSGCSWILMDDPPSTKERMCSTGNGLPILDGVFAVLNVLAGIRLADDRGSVPLVSGLIWAGVHTASAVTGMGWASKCEAQIRRKMVPPRQKVDEVP